MSENILTPIGNLKGSLSSGGLIPGIPVVLGTASGDPTHFMDGTNNILRECKITITPTQEGSGTPAPNNYRPITGISNVTITVSPTSNPDEGMDYNIDWLSEKGIVFGGWIDIATGKGKITKVSKIYDGTENIVNTPYHYLQIPVAPYPHKLGASEGVCICSIFPYSPTYINTDYLNVGNDPNYYWFWPRTTSPYYDNPTAFKNLLQTQYAAGEPMQIVYPLNTELDLEIDPRAILSLNGENYIWSTTGEIEVKYVIDMQKFLQWLYDNVYTP